MVTNEILNVLANAMRNFTYNVVSGRSVACKEDMKNLIIDMLKCCSDDEIRWVCNRLVQER